MPFSGPSLFALINEPATEYPEEVVPESMVRSCGGGCERCVFWLESTGCCRRDCERFGQRVRVEACALWRPFGNAQSAARHRLIMASRAAEIQHSSEAA